MISDDIGWNKTLDQKAEEHKAIADNITDILRDIIAFQGKHVDEQIEELDKIAVAEGKEVEQQEDARSVGGDGRARPDQSHHRRRLLYRGPDLLRGDVPRQLLAR